MTRTLCQTVGRGSKNIWAQMPDVISMRIATDGRTSPVKIRNVPGFRRGGLIKNDGASGFASISRAIRRSTGVASDAVGASSLERDATGLFEPSGIVSSLFPRRIDKASRMTRRIISTASGSERGFINKLIDKASLATARGTDYAQ